MLARTSLVVIALAACGGNSVRHLPDGPPQSDAPVADSPPGQSDAPPADVTFVATVGGIGEPNVTVYFQSADSTLNTTATTDATGTATGSVGDGGFVTAIDPIPSNPDAASVDTLVTWTSVRPGDRIVLNAATGTTAVTFTLPTFSGCNSYEVSTTCGNSTLALGALAEFPPKFTGSASFGEGCIGPQDVEVVAINGNNEVAASFAMTGQTFTNNGSADYSAQAYTTAIARTYTWNDDSDNATIEVQDELESATGIVYQSQEAPAAGTPPTLSTVAPSFGTYKDVVQATATVDTTRHEMDEWGQGATYTGDWGAHRLPDFTSTGAYSATTKQITWTSTGGAVQPNVSVVALEASRSSDEREWEWIVLAGAPPVQLPTLPTTIYDWNVAATDTSSVPELEVANVPGDPGDARDNFGGPAGVAAIEVGAQGVLSLANYQQPQAVVHPSLPFFRR
jgi:hypothetical protein